MASTIASFPADQPYLAILPSRRWLAGIVIALSNFMVVLDLTIANVSLPHIAGDVGVSLDQSTWIITSYAVAEAICVPLNGWLAERYGTVRVFLCAMMGFGTFSLLCGMSHTLTMLVLCRIGQGLCGGPIMPMSQALLIRVFPPKQRPMAMALWAMTVTIGPATGPILGGLISDNASWHWIFFINVPIAIIISLAAYVLIRPVETATRKLPIDRIGLMLMILWIGCLQVLLDIGRDHDWFNDPKMVMLGVIAMIGFGAFVIWELTEQHPIVDLRVFRHRGFSMTVITQALCFGAFFSGVVIVPQWLQVTLGYDATTAGVVSAMHAFAAVLIARFVAQLMPKVDPRALISIGTAWMGLMALVRSQWTSGEDMHALMVPLFLQGFGIPCMFIPLTSMALSSVEPREIASAAGLQNFVRTMATAISTSTVLTIWGDAQSSSRVMLAGRIRPDLVQGTLSNLGMGAAQSRGYISYMVDHEAITLAADHAFLVAALVLFLSSAIVWLTPRVKVMRTGGGGH